MKVDVIQTSFSAGEIGPSLYGRTDIVQYANACQIVENFLPRASGPVISMPGTKYVATVSASSLRTRLISFVFNKTDSYVIEMGDKYMRFFTNRGSASTHVGTEDLSAISDLIAHWKCNDNAATNTVTDTVGTHNGTASTLTSSMTSVGIVNQAFNMNGLYYVTVADHINFTRTAATQPMSILMWVYFGHHVEAVTLLGKYESGGAAQYEYSLWIDVDDTMYFSIYEGVVGSNNWHTQMPLSTGWNFIAVTFKGDGTASSHANIYINGQVASTTFGGWGTFTKMANTTAPLSIGAIANGLYKVRNRIDNVAFFHKELTSNEVASLYSYSAYQLTTVFSESEIFDVKFTQLNDVVWLTSPNHPPQKLVRTSSNEWAISDAPIIGGPFLDDNITATTLTASATTGTVNITVTPTNASLFTVSSGTLGHQGSYWKIGGLAQTNSTTGLQEEGYVEFTHVINSYTATATVIKNLKVSTATTKWAEGAWSAVRGYPSSVTFHERRLWFARTSHEPQKVWGSKVFDYENFALDSQDDDDGLNLGLASNESNEIQWLAPGGKSLVAGTYGGAFVVNSASSAPITPNNANATEEVGYGASSIQPKKLGNYLYYIQRFSRKLREMFYFWDLDTYKAVDRTVLSPHILGDGAVEMDVQRDPEPILWCVRTEGTLALMTREHDQEVTAWSRHSTNGTYTSIAIVPSQVADYDEAWVIVERWINGSQKKYIEYFEDIDVPERQDQCCYLHSALTYDAYNSTSLSSCSISLGATAGSVTLTSSTAYFNGGMIGKRIRAINADGDTLGQGQITATASTTSITLSITTNFNALSYNAGYWGVSVGTVSGLSHLETETVGILADGKTESLTRTVASGAVTLGSNYFVVHVGLSYDQIIYTLPKEVGVPRGTAQGKLQRYSDINLKVNRSTQGFKYGPDADNLDDINLSFTPTVTTLYTGVLPSQGGLIGMRGGYTRGARVYIKNSNPLPIEILNIIGCLETYEK